MPLTLRIQFLFFRLHLVAVDRISQLLGLDCWAKGGQTKLSVISADEDVGVPSG